MFHKGIERGEVLPEEVQKNPKRSSMKEEHEAASLFPMMDEEAFQGLKADIGENGLLEPVWLCDDRILDGRNRYKACCELGIEPQYRHYTGDSPTEFVVSLNLERRHLSSSQRACIAVDMLPMLEEEAKARQGARTDITQIIAEGSGGESRDKAAQATGTNRQYVSDAKKLKSEEPELYEEVKSGGKPLTQAKREVKERKREERRQVNLEAVATAPKPAEIEGVYQTILIDPPWDWGDEGDVDQLGRSRPDYQTMPLSDVAKLPVGKLADDNAHIYLWITNRSLPKGFALLDAWGFRYITCITWVKPHFGMGNYFRGQTEQILFGVRGSLPLLRKDASTLFEAPRGQSGHSSKPAEIYPLIESCSPGPYIEMFSRSERDGWVHWGESSGD